MKINRKLVRRVKRIFKPYNLLIIACIVIVAVSVYILVKPDGSDTSSSKAEVKNTTASKVENQNKNTTTSNTQNDNKNKETAKKEDKKQETSTDKKEITEKKARSIAKKKFKELGEKNLDEKSFTVYKRTREGQTHYYVRSAENTAEIDIYTGKITRLNSAVVNE